jgi:hypothetical protein
VRVVSVKECLEQKDMRRTVAIPKNHFIAPERTAAARLTVTFQASKELDLTNMSKPRVECA